MKTLRFSVLLLLALSAARLMAQDAVLAGWHLFTGHQVHRFLNSAKNADTSLSDVSGQLYGGNGSRNWGSTDGTYGLSEAVGTSDRDGAMSLKTDTVNNSRLYFSVTNNGTSSLALNRVFFDFASVSSNAPRDLQLYYDSGDLNLSNGTLLAEWISIYNNLGANSDYEDVEVDLDLADRSLAPGETATFRFNVSNAIRGDTAMSIDNVAIMGEAFKELRVVTYNIHGGEGPNGEGDAISNLTAFRDNFMQGEDVLCLQEVGAGSDIEDEWSAVLAVFPEVEDLGADANANANVYPYRYRTINENSGNSNKTACAILSKYPFVSTHNKLIQIDPQGDNWERHAQHVQIQLGANLIHIFNFHNTYNFFDNDFESEKSGLIKFRSYVYERMGITSLTEGGYLLMLGDFNVLQDDVIEILPTPARRSNGLDHVSSVPLFSSAGAYATASMKLSDHNAVWATLDVQAPSPDGMQWAITPSDAGTTSITMTAATATDLNGVEYYFSNTTVADQSHDSGWQSSPIYLDTDLDPATIYSYSVKARDKSLNQNETDWSVAELSYTDDGDSLPNDWEDLYFSDLSSTTGGSTEDWDQDGLIDLHEWIAGTDPTDALSRFDVDSVIVDESILKITWNSVAGRTYRITSSSTLLGGWLPVVAGLVADGPTQSYDINDTDVSHMFYRIEIDED